MVNASLPDRTRKLPQRDGGHFASSCRSVPAPLSCNSWFTAAASKRPKARALAYLSMLMSHFTVFSLCCWMWHPETNGQGEGETKRLKKVGECWAALGSNPPSPFIVYFLTNHELLQNQDDMNNHACLIGRGQ